MVDRTRSVIGLGALVAVCAGCLVVAPAAGATSYHVAADGSEHNDCLSPATACREIFRAIGAADDVDGPDTISVGPGTYQGFSVTNADDGLTIEGAGTDPIAGTLVEHDGSGFWAVDVVQGATEPDGVTLRGLRIVVPQADKAALRVGGPSTTVEDVATTVATSAVPVTVSNDYATLRRFELSQTGSDGLLVQPGSLGERVDGILIHDSSIEVSGAVGPGRAIQATRAELFVVTSSVQLSNTLGPVVSLSDTGGALISSLVTGTGSPTHGVSLSGSGIVRLLQATVDVVAPGRALNVVPTAANSTIDAEVSSSIVMDGVQAGTSEPDAEVSIVCRDSDLPPLENGRVNCGAAGSNTHTDPALLVKAPGSDYRLLASSPAIDTGSEAPLGEEPPYDLAGNPRIVDGDGDCTARRDKGAYERAAAVCGSDGDGTGGDFGTGGGAGGTGGGTGSEAGGGGTGTGGGGTGTGRGGTGTGRGGTGTAPGSGGDRVADRRAPVVRRVSLLRRRFAVGRRRTSIAARRRARRGTAFRFTLSEAARVRIVIQRRATGRRARGRCRKPSRRLRRARRCTRWVRAGTLRRSAGAGRNRVRFSGRVGRRALRRGAYRARIVATDRAGNRSRVRGVRFRVVRR